MSCRLDQEGLLHNDLSSNLHVLSSKKKAKKVSNKSEYSFMNDYEFEVIFVI